MKRYFIIYSVNIPDGLRRIEHSYVQAYEAVISGASSLIRVHYRPSAYLANDRRILTASNQLIAGDLQTVEFLHMVSHAMTNVYDNHSANNIESDDDNEDDVAAPPPAPLPGNQHVNEPEPVALRRGRGRRRVRGRGRDLAVGVRAIQPDQGTDKG